MYVGCWLGYFDVPLSRTPRDLLLAALERRRLTGYRSSPEWAWVVFPPAREGGASLQVLHDPRKRRYRVVSSPTADFFTADTDTLGEFKDSDAAAECVEDALGAPRLNGAAVHAPGVNGKAL